LQNCLEDFSAVIRPSSSLNCCASLLLASSGRQARLFSQFTVSGFFSTYFFNRRLAYVAVSRGRYDAQIYTNDKTALAEGLGRDVSHRSALESTRAAATDPLTGCQCRMIQPADQGARSLKPVGLHA